MIGGPSSIHVVLVHPEIHWNTGNAGRTCVATGATLHLIEPLGFSLDDREVKRAGCRRVEVWAVARAARATDAAGAAGYVPR